MKTQQKTAKIIYFPIKRKIQATFIVPHARYLNVRSSDIHYLNFCTIEIKPAGNVW